MFFKHYYKSRRSYSPRRLVNSRGGVLIGAVVTMVIMAALGAGMVSLLGSSAFTEVRANYGQRAYYLAESGFRYAVSEYRHNGGVNALTALSGTPINLPGGGTFELDVDVKEYFSAQEAADDGVPLAEAFEILHGWNEVDNEGNPVIIDDGEIESDGNLVIQLPTDKTLQQYRGLISVNGKEVRYQRMSPYPVPNENPPVTLYKISFADPDDSIALDPTDPDTTAAELVFPVRVADIESTGTFPTSGLSSLFAASRTVKFHWPLSGGFGGTGENGGEDEIVFKEGFDPDDWSISKEKDGVYSGGPGGSWGDFVIEDDGSMKITRTISGAQARFLLGYDERFFYDRWISNDPARLSYDMQIKIKTYNENQSRWLQDFMAGLSFRLDNTTGANPASFGAAFKRGNQAPFNMPNDTTPYIIFWRDRDGQNRELIAYRALTTDDGVISTPQGVTVIMDDDMSIPLNTYEDGVLLSNWETSTYVANRTGGWVSLTDGTLNVVSSGICPTRVSGNDPSINYLTLAETLNVSVPSTLTVVHRPVSLGNQVQGHVDVQVNGGSWITIGSFSNNSQTYQTFTADLSSYMGALKIRFRLVNSSNGPVQNSWYIDNVAIASNEAQPHLVDWSTLLVRVVEQISPRVNNIQIFFGDINGSSSNDSLIDSTRLANPEGEANWPPRSPIDTMMPSEDKFTLVSGDGSLSNRWYWANNSLASSGPFTLSSCTYELVSGGIKEPHAVIQTSCMTTDTYYSVGMNKKPSEIGLHAFGDQIAGNTYFKDFAIRIPGAGGGEFDDPPYVPPIITD